MKKNETSKIWVSAFLLLLSVGLSSHPHVFIEYSAQLIFDQTGLQGVRTEWTFDEMFSWEVLDMNTDGDDIIDETETKEIEANAFSYLSNSGYFAFFLEGNQRFEVEQIEDFSARVESGQLIYSFYIPWQIEATSETKYLKFLFDDEEYFCAVIPQKDGVEISNQSNLEIELSKLDRISYQISFRKKDE